MRKLAVRRAPGLLLSEIEENLYYDQSVVSSILAALHVYIMPFGRAACVKIGCRMMMGRDEDGLHDIAAKARG